MVDGSYELRDALEEQTHRNGRALRTGRPSRVGRAIPDQSHRATSVGRARRGNRSEITPACLQRLAKWPNYRYINHEKDSRHVVHGINILLSTAYYSSALHSPNNASPWVALAVWFALALQFAIARSALAIDFLSNYRRFHMGVFVGVQRRFQSHVLF